ncbi:MAG TPA: hypothetical protein VG934_02680 [Candidatus Paceibacterota bacterium]|nr:hypothetical protein [Candidatus Paceibacterota bacterium]
MKYDLGGATVQTRRQRTPAEVRLDETLRHAAGSKPVCYTWNPDCLGIPQLRDNFVPELEEPKVTKIGSWWKRLRRLFGASAKESHSDAGFAEK